MGDVFPLPELQQLLADIEAAFGDVRLGAGVSLHQARAIDLYAGTDEIAQSRKLDTEERWQDIPDATVEDLSTTLSFLDAEGFRFYMPRFMVYALTHAGWDGSLAVEYAVYACMHKEDETGRYSLLSPAQRRVVARFLRLFADHFEYCSENAAQALDQIWGQYL